MASAHDVLSMWPYDGDGANPFRPRKAGLAMAVLPNNAHDLLHTIQARHWQHLASKHGGEAVWAAALPPGIRSR